MMLFTNDIFIDKCRLLFAFQGDQIPTPGFAVIVGLRPISVVCKPLVTMAVSTPDLSAFTLNRVVPHDRGVCIS